MGILEHGIEQRPSVFVRLRARLEILERLGQVQAMQTLAHAPAVVAAGFDDVELLVAPEPDVTHQEPAVATGLPGESPRVPEPQGEDLGSTATVDERVVWRDRVRGVTVDLDPQDLAEESRSILGIAARGVAGVRIASPTAVARSEVETAVRPEAESPAAVIRLRLAEPQDHALRRRIPRSPAGSAWNSLRTFSWLSSALVAGAE